MQHPSFLSLIRNPKALFIVNHSGGKDSQAMLIRLRRIIPLDRLVIIHAHLPEVEWDGVIEHIDTTSPGIERHVVTAVKTFFEMVEHRGMFPDKHRRQCTSDLKRGPIEKKIREISKTKGYDLIINCVGLRGEESTGRAKLEKFKFSERNSKAGRRWYDWLPIHTLTRDEVFKEIREAGESPHWAYGKGMTRLSCCFCIMANKNDLTIASKLRPELFQRYVETEKRLNHTLQMSGKPLTEIVEN